MVIIDRGGDAIILLGDWLDDKECKEGIRFLKSEFSLERIRTFSWTAICRLVLLGVLVTLYLRWLIEREPKRSCA